MRHRRLFAGVLSVLLLLAALAGCQTPKGEEDVNIRQAFLEQYVRDDAFTAADLSVRYVGQFDGFDAVYVDGVLDYTQAFGQETVDGVTFLYATGQRLLIFSHGDGRLYGLQEARESGVLDKDGLQRVFEAHRAAEPSRYGEANVSEPQSGASSETSNVGETSNEASNVASNETQNISQGDASGESSDAVTEEPTVEEPSEPVESTESSEPSEPVESSASSEPSQPIHVMTEMEQRIFDLLNEERVKNGRKELAYNGEIYDCALLRAQEAAVEWSHTRPNGELFNSVFAEFGISTKGYTVGENLGRKFDTAERIMEALMNSEGHRDNILFQGYDSVCIAVAADENGVLHLSQLFMGKSR